MRTVLFLLCLLIAIPSQAAPGGLETIVSDLQQTYQGAQTWQAEFFQSTFVDLLGREISKKGVISVKKPGKLRIEYQGAGAKLYLSDGKKLWIYTPGDEQVEVYQKISHLVSHEALTFLQGLGDLRRQFKVSLYKPAKGDNVEVGRGLKFLLLTPLREDSTVEKMVLAMDPKDHLVRELVLFNASGNKTRYVFKNIRLNAALAEELFEYKKPQGAREIKG